MRNGLIIDEYGTKVWWRDDILHRLDGPAIEGADGTKWWFQNDQCHRIDGPAYEGVEETKRWFIWDVETPELEDWLIEHGLYGIPYSEWDDTMKMAAKLMWE